MRQLRIGLCVLAVCALALPSLAADYYWDAGGAPSTLITTPANWDPDGLATSGTTTVLHFGSDGSTATWNANFTVGTIDFSRDADFTLARDTAGTLSIYSGVTISSTLTPHYYLINAPYANVTWGANRATVTQGDLRSSGGGRA